VYRTHWVISLFGLVRTLSRITTCTRTPQGEYLY